MEVVSNSNEPAIETDAYNKRREEYNPGVAQIPREFHRFNKTELGDPSRAILYAADDRELVHDSGGYPWNVEHAEAKLESGIETFADLNRLAENQDSFARGRMLNGHGDLMARFIRAKTELEEEGPRYMQQKQMAHGIVGRAGQVQGDLSNGCIAWGREIRPGDCEVQDIAIGTLHVLEADCGGAIRM